MTLVDVVWTAGVNMLVVVCDCGTRFGWPSNVSAVDCPLCARRELWHDVYPREEIWNLPVMENRADVYSGAKITEKACKARLSSPGS